MDDGLCPRSMRSRRVWKLPSDFDILSASMSRKRTCIQKRANGFPV